MPSDQMEWRHAEWYNTRSHLGRRDSPRDGDNCSSGCQSISILSATGVIVRCNIWRRVAPKQSWGQVSNDTIGRWSTSSVRTSPAIAAKREHRRRGHRHLTQSIETGPLC